MRARLLFVLLSTAIVSALVGSTPAQAILNGTDDGGAHPYVGWLATEEQFCTASAISPTVVVTAAHCAADGQSVSFYYDIDGSGFTQETGLAGFDGKVTGTAHRFPGFCGECGKGLPGFSAGDLAVVVLDSAISLPRYAQLPSVGLSDRLKSPSVSYVGYGVDRLLHTTGKPVESLDYNFVRNTATGQVITNSAVLGDFLRVTSKQKVRLCPGDSGSPILYGDAILAVYSFGNGSFCASPGHAYRLDTPAALSFVRSFL